MKLKRKNNKKDQPNIQYRLVTGLVLLITLSVLISIFYINDIEKLNRTVKNIVKHPYTVSNSVRDIKLNINAMHRSMKDVVLAKNEEQLKEAVDKVNEYEKDVFEKFNVIFERFLGEPKTVEDAYKYFKNWKPIRDKVILLTIENKIEEAADITKGEGADYVDLLMSKTDSMIAFADSKANAFNNESFKIMRSVNRKAIAFILSALILAVITFIWIIGSINRPLDRIINQIKDIPPEQLINKLPENKRNKLVLLDFVFKELEDHKKMLELLVTERTKELQESKGIINHAIDNAPIGIVEVGLNNKFKKANQEFCNLIGYSQKELLNISFNEITVEEDKQIGNEIVKKMLEGKIPFGKFEKKYIHKSGKVIYCSITTSLVSDFNKKPLYFFAQIVDVTKQKQFENELIRHKKQLEEIVEKRTKLLDEKAKKLYDSQQALTFLVEDVNESRDEMKKLNEEINAKNKELEAFSYSVSHDLRAPLRGIHGFTQILMEDYASKLDEEGKRVCHVIMDNSHKMGRLIDDLLAFSRLSRSDMQKSAVDMKKMVNSMFYEITSEESRKKIILDVGDLCNVHGDSAMLKQVWTNLLSNAIKFSSKRDKAMISVACKKEKNRYVYCISDNGAGFDMKYVNKLFGVFQRLHSANEFKGTGVGLANVQRIVLRHGGEVWAEGKVGKGASFYFSLPIIKTDL